MRRRLIGALLGAALVGAVVALGADLATERERRLADMDRDFVAAAAVLAREIGSAHDAVREVGADPAARVAALNGRAAFFDEVLRALRSRYPDMRALSATAGYGRLLRSGEPELSALLEDVYDSPLCLHGRAYTVLWAPLGREGVLGIAFDPEPTIEEARRAVGGRLRLSLLEQLTTTALLVDGVPSCADLPEEVVYRQAAHGERSLRFEEVLDGAVEYAPLRGTILVLLAEEERTRGREATFRHVALAAVAGASAALLAVALAGTRRRSGGEP